MLFRLRLAYEGTEFEGFQAQSRRRPDGDVVRTVQGVLEHALGKLAGGERVAVAGAGRTDAGVHALGQVVSFELSREIAPADLHRALNGTLPPDLRVLEAGLAPRGFHARKSALSKLYRYVLDTGEVQLPDRRRFAGHVPARLDRGRVRAAARLFVGRQDFASLQSSGGSVRTSVRHVTRSEVHFEGRTLIYEVEADGFLRKMVRSMVGGLIGVGRGALDVAELRRLLLLLDRRAWPPPAEARGLTLVRVSYGTAPGVTIDAF